MKYWRGYLVAAVIAVCTWALDAFAEAHWRLVDVVYPYVSRMIQNALSLWSSGVSFSMWQVLVLAFAGLIITSAVLMIVLRWNPIQWFGWVLTAFSVVGLLNTGLYGLNTYAAPLAEDVRLTVSDYTVTELSQAATYYRDLANEYAVQVQRDGEGNVLSLDFDTQAQQAGEGFRNLTYNQFLSAFAGSTAPVKQLRWSGSYTAKGQTGAHFPLTGEAAVNPKTPAAGLPFAMCLQMAKRMCIANDQDAVLAAFMACRANSAPEFKYSAFFMAYRYCRNALAGHSNATLSAELIAGENPQLKQDLSVYDNSFAAKSDKAYAKVSDNPDLPQRSHVSDLLVSVYIQEVLIPLQLEENVTFDPMDETQVDLSGLANAKLPEETQPNE